MLSTHRSKLRRASGDDGVSLVLVALFLVIVVGVAAFGIDIGNARQIARKAQGSVDAAALAGAHDLPLPSGSSADSDLARQAAMDYAVRNEVGDTAIVPSCPTGVATCSGVVDGIAFTVTTPYTGLTGSTVPPSALVYVRACRDTPTYFAGVLGQESPRVCREAVGRRLNASGGFDFGLVATNPSQCAALTFAGNSDTILSSNGAVMVNSNCTNGNTGALDASGSSWQLITSYIGVVGSVTLAPCDPATQTDKCTQTVPNTGINPFGDPLAVMVEPARPPGPALTCPQNGGAALGPGLYSSQCRIQNGDVTMQPGVYYLEDGFLMNGGSLTCVDSPTATCDDTGILLFVKGGSVTLNGNGVVDLPGYEISPFGRFTIWQAQDNTNGASINGTADFVINSVYIPSADLKANGNGGGAQINIEGIVVSNTVGISGTFDFNIQVPLDAPVTPAIDDIGLAR